jgi:hypothetical protein
MGILSEKYKNDAELGAAVRRWGVALKDLENLLKDVKVNDYTIEDYDMYVKFSGWNRVSPSMEKGLVDIGFLLEEMDDEDRGKLFWYQYKY